MSSPWYKQFWPWFLIAIPLSSFMMGGVIFHLATTTEDSLVVDEYYKEGKAINAKLDKLEKAKTLGINVELNVYDEAVVVKFLTGLPRVGTALRLSFFHVTLQERDFSVLLTQDAAGNFRAPLATAPQGKWTLTLAPLDEEWKLQQQFVLPSSTPLLMIP